VFEEKAGLVPLDLTRENGKVVAARLAAPQKLTLGDEIAPAIVAEICGLAANEIETSTHQPVIASCGNNFVFAEVKSRAILAKASVRTDAMAKHIPMNRAIGVHLYANVREHGVEIQSRMFAPLFGVPEDPATGSSNVVLIGLLSHFQPEKDLTLVKAMGQGFDMGRPSLLDGAAEKKAGRVVDTYIGGRCVPMLKGTIDLD
jgi:trans-2,3-dihydro-3-hydroxyanthranilate isomerase